ncbi:hypothetical protein EES43_11260 [Streptomyces sp. ADI96-02]|nr:hypothetical protein EES43_11260 [Streptomyces sp. ADI96-02]
MPAVPSCILDPIRDQFLALLPVREDRHPLGCHNPRISDAVVFDRLVRVLVFGCGYERAADEHCSATTLRRRRDEWISEGVMESLRLLALAAYDRMIGLELDHLSADGCITKAPSGGECAGKSPVDRAKLGLKRSQLTDGTGIPLVTEPASANVRDHTLLPATLDRFTALEQALGPLPEHPHLAGRRLRLPDRPRRPGQPRDRCPYRPARREDPDPDRRPVGRRAHELLDEQLRQAPTLHRTPEKGRRVLPRPGRHRHHGPLSYPTRLDPLPLEHPPSKRIR